MPGDPGERAGGERFGRKAAFRSAFLGMGRGLISLRLHLCGVGLRRRVVLRLLIITGRQTDAQDSKHHDPSQRRHEVSLLRLGPASIAADVVVVRSHGALRPAPVRRKRTRHDEIKTPSPSPWSQDTASCRGRKTPFQALVLRRPRSGSRRMAPKIVAASGRLLTDPPRVSPSRWGRGMDGNSELSQRGSGVSPAGKGRVRPSARPGITGLPGL